MPETIVPTDLNPGSCCVCHSTDATGLFSAAGHRIVRCQSCGMVYTGDFREEEARYSDKEYFDANYVTRWDDFCGLFQALVTKILSFKPGGTLLDVGTGLGTLLHVARASGFAVKGVEISPWASGFARDEKALDVFCGTLEDARFASETFDVVVINHVLEHVPDPGALLLEARRVLKKDGLLVVGVPNIGSLMARIAGGRWSSLRPAEHIWHFTPETLKRLVFRCGFSETYFESSENHMPAGWKLRDVVIRLVNRIAIVTGRSEAMLLFCGKE